MTHWARRNFPLPTCPERHLSLRHAIEKSTMKDRLSPSRAFALLPLENGESSAGLPVRCGFFPALRRQFLCANLSGVATDVGSNFSWFRQGALCMVIPRVGRGQLGPQIPAVHFWAGLLNLVRATWRIPNLTSRDLYGREPHPPALYTTADTR